MTLPAHRFREREIEERKKKGKAHSWAFDFDETITKAPKQVARIAAGLKELGDSVYVVTGNDSPRSDLIKRLEDYGFPFDDLIQYQDDQTDGLNRAAILKQINAWGAFDDRAGRGYTFAKICPHFFLIAKPPEDAKKRADGPKKAKKTVDKQQRAEPPAVEQRYDDVQESPPNLRDAAPGATQRCGTCHFADHGLCTKFNNWAIATDQVCDAYQPKS